MVPEDAETREELCDSRCRQGGEPGDCFKLCRCGHICDEHDYRKPGACMVEGCDCWTWRDA